MVHSKKRRDGGRFFPEVLYKVVDDPSTDSMISWSQSGKSFIVWNESEFIRDVLLRFFHFKEVSSLIITRLLDSYGFSKVVESELCWEYAHDRFLRGKPELTEQVSFLFGDMSETEIMERQKKRVLEIKEIQKQRAARSLVHNNHI